MFFSQFYFLSSFLRFEAITKKQENPSSDFRETLKSTHDEEEVSSHCRKLHLSRERNFVGVIIKKDSKIKL